MLEKLSFYVRHSLNDLRVNGQRTLFALLCIASGVAAIVSLQTLAVMINNTLEGNLQQNNRGDIQLQLVAFNQNEAYEQAVADGLLYENTITFFGQQVSEPQLSPAGLTALQDWFAANYPGEPVQITYRQPFSGQISAFFGTGTGTTLYFDGQEVPQVTPIVVDTAVYPFYGSVVAQNGSRLPELMTAPTDVVLDVKIAEALGITQAMVDSGTPPVVTLNGSTEQFTVRGIVNTDQEVKDPLTDFFAGAFGGFYYLDQSAVPLFDSVVPGADRVYIQLPAALDVVDVSSRLSGEFSYLRAQTTEDLRENYQQLADAIGDLVAVMGLVSMLIGSIGIINTMQVIVRRRTLEVAVLKTMGLQANQVTLLFLVEAFIMGVIGSLAGIVLGLVATFFIRGAVVSFVGAVPDVVLAPGPILSGFVTGVLVTAIFGFIPTLSAGLVRPGTVLRPNDDIVPRAGWARTLVALVFVIIALALVATPILGDFQTALIVTVGAFIGAGVLYVQLWLLILLIGRFFPSLGIVDVRISLRQMLVGRRRAAITLLALVVGVFSLSTITLMAQAVGDIMEYALESFGGNLIVTTPTRALRDQVTGAVDAIDGASYQINESYSLELITLQEGDTVLTLEELGPRMDAALLGDTTYQMMRQRQQSMGMEADFFEPPNMLRSDLSNVAILESPEAMPADRTFIAGGPLQAEGGDVPAGAVPGIVITETRFVRAAGIDVGDRLTFGIPEGGFNVFGGAPASGASMRTITLEVVGIIASPGLTLQTSAPQDNLALASAFVDAPPPNTIVIIADIPDAQLSSFRQTLARIPGVFAIEASVITALIDALLGAFITFPTMVALLGLIVGGVVIANSVALTTMERRREIAVMKAVGLRRERVLGMILLENAVLGVIGGMIGVGIGLIALVFFVASLAVPGSTIPFGSALVLMLLCVLVALIAAVTTAWGASGEKPLNVLRYE